MRILRQMDKLQGIFTEDVYQTWCKHWMEIVPWKQTGLSSSILYHFAKKHNASLGYSMLFQVISVCPIIFLLSFCCLFVLWHWKPLQFIQILPFRATEHQWRDLNEVTHKTKTWDNWHVVMGLFQDVQCSAKKTAIPRCFESRSIWTSLNMTHLYSPG